MSAKIEIFSKPVISSFPSGPQHMYIIYTNEAGEKRILRGGPEGSSFANAMIGNIEVVDVEYKISELYWGSGFFHELREMIQ